MDTACVAGEGSGAPSYDWYAWAWAHAWPAKVSASTLTVRLKPVLLDRMPERGPGHRGPTTSTNKWRSLIGHRLPPARIAATPSSDPRPGGSARHPGRSIAYRFAFRPIRAENAARDPFGFVAGEA
jgi:hypothetical protein